jgi:hypothetical protein
MPRFAHPFDLPESVLAQQMYSGYSIARESRDLGMFFTTIGAALDYALDLGERIATTWDEVGIHCSLNIRFFGSCYDQIEVEVVHHDTDLTTVERVRIVLR